MTGRSIDRAVYMYNHTEWHENNPLKRSKHKLKLELDKLLPYRVSSLQWWDVRFHRFKENV